LPELIRAWRLFLFALLAGSDVDSVVNHRTFVDQVVGDDDS
jgi:hypothetical protein